MQKLLGAVMSLSLAAFAAAPAAAQDARPPGNNDSIQAAVVLGNKKATKVTVEQNAPMQTLSPFVYHPLDAPKVLNCGTTTCEIEAEITTQLQRSTAVSTSVAFRFVIDGNAVDGAGYWAGLLDHDFYEQSHTRAVSAALSPGPHTVQTFVYVSAPATAVYRNVKYTQYKP